MYISPKLPKRAEKRKVTVFSPFKNAFLSKKVCCKVFYVKTFSAVIRHLLACLTMHKWLVGDIPLNVNFVFQLNHPLAWQLCRSALSRRLMSTIFASQWVEFSTKFITFISQTNWGIWMHYNTRIITDKNYISWRVVTTLWPAQCVCVSDCTPCKWQCRHSL